MPARPKIAPRFSAFFVLALLLLCAQIAPFGKGHAMGSPTPQPTTTRDIISPISGLQGHIARDDSQALTAGYLRVYTSPDITAPRSIKEQADLIRPLLTSLTALPPLSDVTERAHELGASIEALAKAVHGTGKYTRPNSVLTLGADGGQPAVFLARIAQDAPQAAVNVTLYCLADTGAVTISHFGPIRPHSLIEIKETVCTSHSD